MNRSVLELSRKALSKRQFSRVIALLEPNMELYRENFDYYFILGTACLYIGDIGNANLYYQRARDIKLIDSKLMLGQAAIFLRRGDTDRAIEYYLEILQNEPSNEIAKNAMNFIRKEGDFNTITQWVDTGKIERFYPPLGLNPCIVRNCVLAGIACGLLISLVFVLRPAKKIDPVAGPRANLTKLELTKAEKSHAQENDLSGTTVTYLLDNKAVTTAYENAMLYFQQKRDNAAQVEINRLLNSNAAFSIKQKANVLMTYLSSPTFDSLKDNYSYETVASSPELYLDCWVKWNGRVANLKESDSNTCSFDFLVGYEDMKNLKGSVPVTFSPSPQPSIDGERAIQVLGQIKKEGNSIVLRGKSIYQPLQGKSLPKE